MDCEIKLSEDEVNMIFEALETWEQESQSQAAFSGLLGAALGTGSKTEYEAELDQMFKDAKAQAYIRKRAAILLKAKLIQAMDEITTRKLFNGKS